MKKIKASYEILTPINKQEIYRSIEIAGRTCYTEDVDLLTMNGWKNIKNIAPDEFVMTYNKSKNIIEYNKSNTFSKKYNGSIYTSTHRCVSFSVTDNHRMFATRGYLKDKNYDFIEIEDFLKSYKSNESIYRVPKWIIGSKRLDKSDYMVELYECENVKNGFRPTSMSIFKQQLTDDFIVIMGAYITEGHIFDGKKHKTGSYLQITQSEDSPLFSKVIKSLKHLGWKYSIDFDRRKPKIKWIKIWHGVAFLKWMGENCGILSVNKKIPDFFRLFSDRQMILLLDILYMGDGSHNTERTSRYLSISVDLLNQVQEIFVLLGKSATISYDVSKSQNCYVEENLRDSWLIRSKHIKTTNYCGLVYCTLTDNGVVCIRKNGHIMWCGNCYKSEDKITEDSAEKFVKMIVQDKKHLSVIEHISISVRFIANRGFTHELVRHRIGSYSQESTRYCNYNKAKFGNEITCIDLEPAFEIEDNKNCDYWKMTNYFLSAWEQAEKNYNELISLGCSPQMARNVLPIGLKTEIVATYNLRQWREVFKQRTAPQVHPNMRELMIPLLKEFAEKMPEIFGDLV